MHYGLIAQETEKVIAASEKGKTLDPSNTIVSYDKKNDRYGIKYTELISPIIQAIQDLYNRTTEFQKNQSRELATLKAENVNLGSDIEKMKATQAAQTEVDLLKKENSDLKARLDRIEREMRK